MLFPIAFLPSCNDGGERPLPNPPKKIEMYGDYINFFKAAEVMVETIRVRVTDTQGKPTGNVYVIFNIAEGAASLTQTEVLTGTDGIASVDVSLANKLGQTKIQAAVPGLVGSPIDFYFYVAASDPAAIEIVDGNEQEGLAGERLREFSVKVLDEFGNPVGSAPVVFDVKKGNGELSSSMSLTNDDGIAGTIYKLGNDGPESIIRASVGNDVSIDFKAYTLIPVNFESAQNIRTAIRLNWSQTINPTFSSYVVYRAVYGIYQFVPIATIDDIEQTTYDDAGLDPGKRYIYRIRVSAQNRSIESTERSADAGTFIDVHDYYDPDIEFDEKNNLIYVTNTWGRKIYIVSMDGLAKVDSIELGGMPRSITLSNDGSRLFVTMVTEGSFKVIDAGTRQIVKTVDVSAALGTSGIADIYHTSNGELFVSSDQMYIVKVNVADNYSTTRVASNRVFFAGSITFVTDNGTNLYVEESRLTPNSLLRLNLMNDTAPVVSEDAHGTVRGTRYAALSPNGDKLYLRSGQIVNSQTFDQVGLFSHGAECLALSPNGTKCYTVYFGAFSVFDTNTQLKDWERPVGISGLRMFITKDNSTAFVMGTALNRIRIYKITLP